VGTRSQDAWTGAALKAAALRSQEIPGAAEKRRALGYNPWNLMPR